VSKDLQLIAGNSNRLLAEAVSSYLGQPLTKASIRRFSDMEVFAEILENVRGKDTFVIQSTSYPANDNLMELLITIDALRRGSARRITAVIPYFGYARQDRKTGGRTPISAKLVANLITAAGVDRVLTMELHAGQIQGFFDIPVDNLVISPIFLPDIEKRFKGEKIVLVSPDVGGAVRARAMAKRIDADIAIIDKRREQAGVSEVMHVIGDVRDSICIMVDDIVDTAGTLCKAAQALKDQGAMEVFAYAIHPVLSGKAIENIENSDLNELIVTDTIPLTEAAQASEKVTQLTLAGMLAETIRRINNEESVSEMFADY